MPPTPPQPRQWGAVPTPHPRPAHAGIMATPPPASALADALSCTSRPRPLLAPPGRRAGQTAPTENPPPSFLWPPCPTCRTALGEVRGDLHHRRRGGVVLRGAVPARAGGRASSPAPTQVRPGAPPATTTTGVPGRGSGAPRGESSVWRSNDTRQAHGGAPPPPGISSPRSVVHTGTQKPREGKGPAQGHTAADEQIKLKPRTPSPRLHRLSQGQGTPSPAEP